MNWINLTSTEQLNDIVKSKNYSIIFKHSTRCSTSLMAKRNFEKDWNKDSSIKLYYLDLLNFRTISTLVESLLGIKHESPQVLLIKEGICHYYASHSEIDAEHIITQFHK